MSQHALLIKMTSMGDLIHALPAITDASRAIPGIQFDWVADEAFAQVASWHPAVNRIIKSAHRRWKKNLRQVIGDGELKQFYQTLNAHHYDTVIDSQNGLKSALVAWLRRGPCHGLDKHSVREKPAHWAYRFQHHCPANSHAIDKHRLLFAKALGYALPDSRPDYGIDRERLSLPELPLPEQFIFLVHNASKDNKLWPEAHWLALIEKTLTEGYELLLPCGNEEEYQRAKRLADHFDGATALPKLTLSETATVIDKAKGAVCCDTGLGHMAGMLDTPAVSLYGATDPRLIGATGLHQKHLTAESMQAIEPQQVWDELQKVMASAEAC